MSRLIKGFLQSRDMVKKMSGLSMGNRMKMAQAMGQFDLAKVGGGAGMPKLGGGGAGGEIAADAGAEAEAAARSGCAGSEDGREKADGVGASLSREWLWAGSYFLFFFALIVVSITVDFFNRPQFLAG